MNVKEFKLKIIIAKLKLWSKLSQVFTPQNFMVPKLMFTNNFITFVEHYLHILGLLFQEKNK
jgi:hypothetical protein